MDISLVTENLLDAEWLTVRDLRGAATDFAILLAAPDSAPARRAWSRLRAASLAGLRAGRMSDSSDPEELDARDLDFLAGLTLDWRGLENQGRAVVFSAESARSLYAEHPFIREQVAAFTGERRHFLRG